jgi:type II secretory pathway pseudopilin PulG
MPFQPSQSTMTSMDPSRLRDLTHRRRWDAFTLIEAVIASALVAAGLLGVLAIIVQFTDRASTELSLTELSRQVATFDAQFQRDIEAARPCAQNRIGVTFTRVTSSAVGWTIDPDGDGQVDEVVWEIVGGQVHRAITPDTGGCTFGAASPSVVLTGVAGLANASSDGPKFYPTFRSWTEPAFTSGSEPGQCTISKCVDLHTLVFDVEVVARDGTVYPITRRVEFPENRSRLR